MKENGIRVRAGEGYVSVQRRPLRMGWSYAAGFCLLFVILSVAYTQLPDMLLAFHQRRFGASLLGIYLVVVLPILICIGLIRTKVAEVLHIDRKNVQIAGRRSIGRWERETMPASSISNFQFGLVRQSRHGSIKGLVLNCQNGKRKFMEGLTATQANEILQQSEHLGLNVVIDPAMDMMVDVERRGLFGK